MSISPSSTANTLPQYIPGAHTITGCSHPIILSANENSRGPSPKAIEAMNSVASSIHRYPNGDPEELKSAISAYYNLDLSIGEVILGAGSDEILHLLAQGYAHPGKKVLISQYGFLMYKIAAMAAGAQSVFIPETDYQTDVDGILDAVDEQTCMIFIANPNNPTGSYLSSSEINRLVKGLPDHVLLVLDCAYSEYVTQPDYSDHHDLVQTNQVVVTHTFSKIHGLAGLRLGWAFAPTEIAAIYHRLRSPFNISSTSIAAGIGSLSDASYLEESRTLNSDQKALIVQALAELKISYLPSEGNFLLLEFSSSKIAQSCNTHLQQAGILIRAMDSYGLPHCLRMSIGNKDENQTVLDALRKFHHG